MKKLTALLLSLCAAACLFAFTACSDGGNNEGGSPTPSETQTVDHNVQICAAYSATSDVLTITDSTSLKDYMDALAEDGLINFTGSDSDYGYYISSMFGVEGSTISSTSNFWEGYSWMIYTTLTTLDGVIYSDTATTITYEGITFYCASYGVSYLPCVEGESYAFVYTYTSSSW